MTRNPPKTKFSLNTTCYEDLLGSDDWNRLHPDIRKRFGCESVHKAVTYKGMMSEVYLSFFGVVLANLCRLIGTPLALYSEKNVETTVKVYPNKKLSGMIWDRFYNYSDRKKNRIKSTKCIEPETGLIEVVGFGFGMHLNVFEKNSEMHFESTRFFWQLGQWKIPIPHIVTPGKTTVIQKALDSGSFQFSLHVSHPILGLIFRQIGVFKVANEV